MRSAGQIWLVRATIGAIPLIVIGLSLWVFFVEMRHRQVTENEVHAVSTLFRVDRATILLDQQRLLVAQSIYLPLDRAEIQARSTAFQQQLGNPDLFSRPEIKQLQRQILPQQEVFTRAAISLPPSPTVSQVQVVDARAQRVIVLLDTLRERHAADLNALLTSERRQRDVSLLVIFIIDLVILLLVLTALLLFTRVGKREAEAAALRATDQLRSELIAFTAHELRNPASAIKTGAALLRESDLEPDIRASVIESVNRSADALTRLVLNLLSMGRLEEGRLQLRRQVVSLPSVIDDLVKELDTYHPGLENRVQRTLPPVQVSVDPEYLKLAISNILDNAIKYAPPQSPITMSGDIQLDTVTIHIHNEGEGISPEVMPHLFEKYETTGTAPYSARRGIGLGLYMTRLLIEVHGGTIKAVSAPGEGATISFTLPLAQPQTTEKTYG